MIMIFANYQILEKYLVSREVFMGIETYKGEPKAIVLREPIYLTPFTGIKIYDSRVRDLLRLWGIWK